jgi:hypothetical protein
MRKGGSTESHIGDYEEYYALRCDAMQSGRSSPVFPTRLHGVTCQIWYFSTESLFVETIAIIGYYETIPLKLQLAFQ